MMNVEIRRPGIEGLVGHVPVEETLQATAEPGLFQELEEVYPKKLDESVRDFGMQDMTQVLTPEQINAFLQTTLRHEEHRFYASNAGYLISRLIQNSYDNGHNNFTLDTTALKEIHNIGYGIEGTREPIEITIIGNTGIYCGYRSENSTYRITGNTGSNCGDRSENSTFNITGNTGRRCGAFSESSTYHITGNTGYHCGYDSKNATYHITGNTGSDCGWSSKNSTFNIAGNTRTHCGLNSESSTYNIRGTIGEFSGFGSIKLTFKTPNRETLQKMMKDVPEGNRVIFIQNGKEEIVRDYDSKP